MLGSIGCAVWAVLRIVQSALHHRMCLGDSCIKSRARQTAVLQGMPSNFAGRRALQLAGALVWSDRAFVGAVVVPGTIHGRS